MSIEQSVDSTSNSLDYLNIVEKYGQIIADQKALDEEIARRLEWILGNADQRNKLIEMKCCIEEVLHDLKPKLDDRTELTQMDFPDNGGCW